MQINGLMRMRAFDRLLEGRSNRVLISHIGSDVLKMSYWTWPICLRAYIGTSAMRYNLPLAARERADMSRHVEGKCASEMAAAQRCHAVAQAARGQWLQEATSRGLRMKRFRRRTRAGTCRARGENMCQCKQEAHAQKSMKSSAMTAQATSSCAASDHNPT